MGGHAQMHASTVTVNSPRQLPNFHVFFSSHAGSPDSPEAPPVRVVLSCVWMMTLTLLAVYTGNLFAILTVRRHTSVLDGLQDLAQHHPEFQAGFTAGSAQHDLFAVSSSAGAKLVL